MQKAEYVDINIDRHIGKQSLRKGKKLKRIWDVISSSSM